MRTLPFFILPFLAFGLVGVGAASAHGLMMTNLTPDEIAAHQQKMLETHANFFGISIDQMKAYWAEGKTLKEVANIQGMSDDELRAKMAENHKARLKEHLSLLVQKGVITQAQADQRLLVMENRFQESGLRKPGRGFGYRFHKISPF
ncbi:MAG: hypothetical protein KGZ30_04605 [Anaplasmataceae bacterium]|nr:hypothetical protein [Anaplasmataceae bacterium]MBS3903621.1 hypothetical protein [Anaplasmataceae bacterium]